MKGISNKTVTTEARNTRFETEFSQITGIRPRLDAEYLAVFEPLVKYLEGRDIGDYMERRSAFLALVNKKFELNATSIADFYAQVAKLGYTFHFHQKNSIQKAFDAQDKELFEQVLRQKKIDTETINSLARFFTPVSELETIKHIENELENPSKLRIDKTGRNIDGEILKALFSAFLWVSLPEKEMHGFFDTEFSPENYSKSFWEQLQLRSPLLFNRKNALHVVRITRDTLKETKEFNTLRDKFISTIPTLYKDLNNYGFLTIVIDSLSNGKRALEWELASDIILAAEKFNEVPLQKNYFQWERIKKDTESYIEGLDEESSRFELVNEGFTYRDTFILENGKNEIEKLVLIFQKNERDETVIPCPACRSSNVQGNSYSSLGVKSWECKNPLCPDRSKYNRGKRYSFRGLLMQRAIENEADLIPTESVRRWRRDVVQDVSDEEIIDMLTRHYSMSGDILHFHNWQLDKKKHLGRSLEFKELRLEEPGSFFDSHIFSRYALYKPKTPKALINLGDKDFQVYEGDASEVLTSFPENTFDGAVTSPPYYNAREYSQWANMYCYLHDMLNVNAEVFRTLKPGALYLYNIFDYFDNENTVALSAMGQKRMILSAYTVDLFRRIGFQIVGNIPWDKGDIEGKRGFNAGNYSPFYQAPFNCWEHILIFQKPPLDTQDVPLSSNVLKCKPVMKMVSGKNTHGHTAPFPDALPEVLTSQLPKGSLILDPFGGSLTTGRVAERNLMRSVCVELSREYCDLGLQKRDQEKQGVNIFDPASKEIKV